jgi:hypothetical protein
MGLVITIPLMLAVFAPDIAKQVTRDRNAGERAAQVDLDRQFAAIPRLRAERANLLVKIHTVTTGAVLEQSPEYARLARLIGRYVHLARSGSDSRLVRSYRRRIAELGPQIKVLRKRLLDQEATSTATVHTAERARIDEITAQLRQLTREKAAKAAEIRERYAGPAGLAAHVTALEHVAGSEAGVGTIKTVLVIFLVAIDSLPAVLLTLSLLGRKTPYEALQDAEEAATAAMAEQFEEQRRAAAFDQAKITFDAQRHVTEKRIAEQVRLQREMDEIFIGVVGDTLRPATGRVARERALAYMRQFEEAEAGARRPEPAVAGRRRRRPPRASRD